MSWQRKPEQDETPLDANEIRRLAMNLLARREHSRKELFDKLGARNVDAGVLEATIERLTGEGLQCDRRFAENYSRTRQTRGQGPVRIRMELGQRGVDSALIEDAIKSLGVDWAGLAREARVKRFGSATPRDYREKARQSRFLSHRGFTHEQILSALSDGDTGNT